MWGVGEAKICQQETRYTAAASFLLMNKIIGYFDLASNLRPKVAQAMAAGESVSVHWFPQYLALLLGIIVQRFLKQYMATGAWNLGGFWGWVAASTFLAIMIFPAVYKKSFDEEKPLFFQLCVIFTAGIGWQSLIGTGLKLTSHDG